MGSNSLKLHLINIRLKFDKIFFGICLKNNLKLFLHFLIQIHSIEPSIKKDTNPPCMVTMLGKSGVFPMLCVRILITN